MFILRICPVLLLMTAMAAHAESPISASQWHADGGADAPAGADEISHLEGRRTTGQAARAGTHRVFDQDGAIVFELIGSPSKLHTASWTLDLPKQLSIESAQYFSVRYRAIGINRVYTPVAVISLIGDGEPVAALEDPQIWNDDTWHYVIGKLKTPTKAAKVKVQLATMDSRAQLAIESLAFHATEPAIEWSAAAPQLSPSLTAVDLGPAFNDTIAAAVARSLQRQGMVVDPAGAMLSDANVPFAVSMTGNNLIRPAETNPNDAQVDFLGEKVSQRDFFPISRADTISVDVTGSASEVYLLLIAEMPASVGRYGLPAAPYEIISVDAAHVELEYADGTREVSFPYSIADSGYTIRRAAGAYVVPADPSKQLSRVTILNGAYDKTISLAAMTLNRSEQRQFPQLVEEPPVVSVPQNTAPETRAPFIKKDGDRVTLGNTFYEIALDCSDGFAITSMSNRFNPEMPISLSPDSGISVQIGDRALTGRDFRVDSARANGTSATVMLIAKDATLRLRLDFAVDDSPELGLKAKMTNTGDELLIAEVTFPHLAGVSLGDIEQTWIYFPQYRAINTNQPAFFRALNDRSFAFQMFDLYNPAAGAGIGVMTHNRDGAPIEYTAGKDGDGASAGIIYTGEFYPLEPKQSRELTASSLVFHTGDWHEALAAYRKILPESKRPKATRWFDDVFLIVTGLVSNEDSRRINKTPPLLNRETGKYLVDDVLDANERYYGMKTQIFHQSNWFFNDKLKDETWGEYTGQGYENAGGLANFAEMIRIVQDEKGVPVSLYLIPDRCSMLIDYGKENMEKIALRRADSTPETWGTNFSTCPSVPQWRDFFVNTVKQVQKDTGAKAIYVDVFSFYRGHVCYAKNHGHESPLWTGKATLEFIQALRSALPEDVAIFSEYPLTDVSAQYINGNINYYGLTLHEHFIRGFDGSEKPAAFATPVAQSLYRFAMPGVKQVGFAVGIEGDDNISMRIEPLFFNGEGIFDVTWRLFPSRQLEFVRKSLAVRMKYLDCFTTLDPSPQVPTLRAGVYANSFPGKQRTMWTLLNGRFHPVKGEVIAVDHVAGATYHDVWNDVPLSPRIEGGRAIISVDLPPQGVGCVVQRLEN